MAYGDVTSTSSQESTATTTHVVSLPALANNDLLIVSFSVSGSTADIATTPTGWTLVRRHAVLLRNMYLFTRRADGTEGSTLTVTTSASVTSSHCAMAVEKAKLNTEAPDDSDTGGTTMTAGAFPGEGSPDPYLVLVAYCNWRGTETISTWPANFTLGRQNVTLASNSSSICATALVATTGIAKSHTKGGSNQWVAAAISLIEDTSPPPAGPEVDGSISEGGIAGDSELGAINATRSESDGASTSDTIDATATKASSVSDGTIASETLDTSLTVASNVSDGAEAGDSAAGSRSLATETSESAKSGDSNTASLDASRSSTEGATAGDAITESRVATRSTSETTEAGETLVASKSAPANTTHGAAASDSMAATASSASSITDGADAGESIEAAASKDASTSDNANAGDNQETESGASAATTDGATAGDSPASIAAAAGTTSSGASAGESLETTVNVSAGITDGTVAGESTSPAATKDASISDGTLSGEDNTSDITMADEGPLTEGAVSGETFSPTVNANALLEEGATGSSSADEPLPTGQGYRGNMINPLCCCDPDVPPPPCINPPTVSCNVIACTRQLSYTICGATSAWFIKHDCDNYFADEQIDITLTPSNCTSGYLMRDYCYKYTLHALNECGETIMECCADWTLTCEVGPKETSGPNVDLRPVTVTYEEICTLKLVETCPGEVLETDWTPDIDTSDHCGTITKYIDYDCNCSYKIVAETGCCNTVEMTCDRAPDCYPPTCYNCCQNLLGFNMELIGNAVDAACDCSAISNLGPMFVPFTNWVMSGNRIAGCSGFLVTTGPNCPPQFGGQFTWSLIFGEDPNSLAISWEEQPSVGDGISYGEQFCVDNEFQCIDALSIQGNSGTTPWPTYCNLGGMIIKATPVYGP